MITTLRPAGFSLTELLAVLGIIGSLLCISLPALRLNTSHNLAATGNRLTTLIQFARQNAMTKNALTAVVLMTSAQTDADYRAVTLLEWNPELGWKQLTGWELFPNGIVVDKEAAQCSFIQHSQAQLPHAEQLTLIYHGKPIDHYACRVFSPSGGLTDENVAAEIPLVEGQVRNGELILLHRDSQGNPANYYRVVVIPGSGRTVIERP